MRVTICAYDAPGNVDGPSTWLKRLMGFLREHDVEVRVIFIAESSKKLGFLNECVANGYQCELIPWDMFWEEKIIAILKDLSAHPPDVFIPNYFPTACYAAQFAKRSGIPSLVVLHNDDPMHHALVDEFVNDTGKDQLAGVVAVSSFIKQKIDERKLKNAITPYIPYGAPIPGRVTTLIDIEPLKVVYVGRLLEKQKKISELTEALCHAVRNVPGTEGIIYGVGEVNNVQKVIAEHGQNIPVRYAGALAVDEVQEHFLQSHVYILLSDYEGLPVSLLESMACGVVPVCLNLRSGVGEVISDGENGFLVKDKQESFIQAIRTLAENRQIWRRFSAAARKKIEDEFSQEVSNKKWLELIQQVAAQHHYSGNIVMPSMEELKNIKVRSEFHLFDHRMDEHWKPWYLLRKKIGRVKRALFN